MSSLEPYDHLLGAVVDAWPAHRRFLDKARDNCAVRDTANLLARDVLSLIGNDVDRFVAGYRWMCEMMLEEEMHFRRSGSYRLSSFAEANAEVYQNASLMARYMDGLLLSQVLWPNHLKVFDFYRREFLGQAKDDRHLEIGPGHGLLLHYAAKSLRGEIAAWDVSQTALERTRKCLTTLGSAAAVRLDVRDATTPIPGGSPRCTTIVLSEILEHLERPADLLGRMAALLSPDGLVFINAPVNSPSIDHIFLFRSPEELIRLVEDAGLRIRSTCIAPAAGYSEQLARKVKTTISCALIAQV